MTTKIEWCDETWNPVTGCRKVSAGCERCYAESVARRFWGDRAFTDVQTHADRLDAPLRWRKPRRVFVNSMSDLFASDVPDEFIDRVFAVMALATRHTFIVLTKRPERARSWIRSELRTDDVGDAMAFDAVEHRAHAEAEALGGTYDPPQIGDEGRVELEGYYDGMTLPWPLPNVILGVSVENQATADERIPILLDTPAAVRMVSAEPLLGPVNIFDIPRVPRFHETPYGWGTWLGRELHWIVVGGESGPGARPCDVAWIRDIVRQGRQAGVATFVKQLGSHIHATAWPATHPLLSCDRCPDRDVGGISMHASKGGDPDEWPDDLRVREFPAA